MGALIFFGVICIIIGVVAICMRQFSSTKRYQQLMESEPEKIADLVLPYEETKKDLGLEKNSVAKKATVMGTPKCDEPLISPLGEKPCIWYSMTVTSERKETYTDTDSQGNRITRTRTVTDTLDSSTNSTRFKIDDGTGEVLIDPKDGSFEGTIVSVDKSEQAARKPGATVGFGKFSLTLPNTSAPEILKYHEEIIGLDRPLTVVGMLQDKMGDILIEKGEKTPVIVSTKPFEEMIAETKKTMKTQLLVATICGGLGLVMFLIGLIGQIVSG